MKIDDLAEDWILKKNEIEEDIKEELGNLYIILNYSRRPIQFLCEHKN